VLRALNGESQQAATVAFTQGGDAETAETARRLGAFDCLPWPSSRATVIDSVRRAFAWKHANKYACRAQASMLEAVAAGQERLIASIRDAGPDAAPAILFAALEAHARQAAQHARRVAQSASALAARLHLPARDVAAIHTAALLHDIGKLAMPPALTESTGPVSDNDAAVLRMHASISEAVLKSSPSLAPAAPLVNALHRPVDDETYAAGDQAMLIPVAARILAVCDAYDTLVAQRGFDNPLTHEEANTQLVRRAGTQFDPEIVRAWLELGDQARCC
jgi:response regulator RpfG family c-di-GMP phosphodiesterase